MTTFKLKNMNKLLFIALIIFVLNQVIAQQCESILTNKIIHPTITETYTLDLNDLFKGENLTFSSTPSPYKVINYADPVDTGNSLPTGVTFLQNTILTQQFNEEWNAQTAFLGISSTQYLVYPSSFTSFQSPNFQIGIPLLQGSTPLKCLGLTYINEHQVIVDCYNVDGGLLVNQWQIVDTVDLTKLAQIIPSSNNQQTEQNTLGFGRQIQSWKNSTSGNEYLFRGTLNNQGQQSFMEVFLLKDGLPQVQPIFILTSDNITNIQMVDFQMTPQGTLFVLNQTNVLVTYTIDEINNVLFEVANPQTTDSMSYLSISVGVDYMSPTSDSYSILLATTSVSNNIEEWTVFGSHDPIFSGNYKIPTTLAYNGIPPYLDINSKYVSVQNGDLVYVFERGVADLQPSEFLPFLQTEYLFTLSAIYADINQVPQALLIFTPTNVQVSVLLKPTLVGRITTQQDGAFTVAATSVRGSATPVFCTVDISYRVILANDVTIYKTGNKTLPTTALFPVNTTIEISQYVSGPLINITGTVIEDITPALRGSQYSETSEIVDTSITPFQVDVKAYPTQNILYALNSFDDEQNTLIQFFQVGSSLQGYLCHKGTFNLKTDCISLGKLELTFTVQKLAVLYTNLNTPYALYVVAASNSSLSVYQITKDLRKNIGTMSDLYTTISVSQGGIALNITDFTVVGDRLFVVLNEINQIWVYSITDNVAIRVQIISQQSLTTVNGFYPVGVVARFANFGPVIFINNVLETLIVSTVGDRVQLIGTVQYPLQLTGMSSIIKLVGQELLVIQYQGGSQLLGQISHFSLTDLTNPLKVKNLPLYRDQLSFPLQVSSDDNFLYVMMTNDVLNIYRPSFALHETLYKQYTSTYVITTIFTGASAGLFSYVFIGNGQESKNFRLYERATVTLVPGQYNNEYYTQNTYTLNAQNALGSPVLSIVQKISIYNSQLAIQIDQNALNSENTKYIVQKKGLTVLDFNTTNYIAGDVARYTLDCELCRTGNISINNYLMPGTKNISNIDGVIAMSNYPGQFLTFVLSASAIYSVSSTNEAKQVFTLAPTQSRYGVLFYQKSNNTLLAITQSSQLGINILVLSLAVSPYTALVNQILTTNIRDPQKGYLVGDTIFLLGTLTAKPTLLVLKQDQYTKLFSESQTLTCLDSSNNGVNDISVTELRNVVNGDSNQTIYIVLWTCQKPGLGVQFSTFILDEVTKTVGTIESQVTLDTSNTIFIQLDSQFNFLDSTSYLSVQTLSTSVSGDLINMNIVLTTNNIMNFIFQYVISFNGLNAAIISHQLVTTLPPYGYWVAQNTITFNNDLLAIPYVLDEQAFIALYNLKGLNYSKQYKNPLLMIGGIYEPVASNVQLNLVLEIQESLQKGVDTQILLANQNYNFNLSSIKIQPKLQIVVNVVGSFEKQTILTTAENFYSSQQFNIEIEFDSDVSKKGGLRWWGWILIILALIVVGAGVTLGIQRYNKQQSLVRAQGGLLIQ